MRKSIEELNKLNTKNLLRYYKAERKRYNVAISQYHYGFDAVDYMWDHSYDEYYQKEKVKYDEWKVKYDEWKVKYDEWKDYLGLIKTELNTREHVS